MAITQQFDFKTGRDRGEDAIENTIEATIKQHKMTSLVRQTLRTMASH